MDYSWLLAMAPPPSGTSAGGGGQMSQMLVMVGIIFVCFYFLILRPQQKQQKEKQNLISSVGKGDKVITIGGMHGVVSKVDEKNKTITLEVAKGVKVDFSRAAIASVEKQSGEKNSVEEVES